MKMRFLQIAASETAVFGLDMNGQLWLGVPVNEMDTFRWVKVPMPPVEPDQAQKDFRPHSWQDKMEAK